MFQILISTILLTPPPQKSTCPQEYSSKTAVLLCNPNAGFMEFSAIAGVWLNHYQSMGFGVLVWNYRGYSSRLD